jgi:hypothetical protein
MDTIKKLLTQCSISATLLLDCSKLKNRKVNMKFIRRWWNRLQYERAKIALEQQRHNFGRFAANQVERESMECWSACGNLIAGAGPVRPGAPELCERES